MHRPNSRLISLLCLATLCAAACSDSQAAGTPAATGPAEQKAISLPEDAALEPWRVELIELAMDAAGALPVFPHIKTRSVAQESVVDVCIALEQPRRALEYSARIGNWRRGVGYAGLALHLAERGTSEGVDELIALAEVESRLEGEENPQDWQQDLIRSKIAAALLQLGRAGDALAFETDLEDSEVGRVAAAKAALLSREELEARLSELDGLLATATLDQLRSALEAAIELYARAFSEPELRARCDDWIARASLKVPAQIRLETRLELAREAAELGDPAEASTQVAHARAVLDAGKWLPEDRVPLTARVAAARFAAGDAETARRELTEAQHAYDEGREQIPDFWRGGALRPVAEACVAVGEREQALKLYRRAAEEGIQNPNARPRTEDLVATCLSMARQDVQPDAELVRRLRATREGLADPW
jgi:tetratricopeptide (TPR) repeat protein